jgi:hypothetical protein
MSKTIILDSEYKIESDAYNFTLKYENKRFDKEKQKEVKSANEWHFPNLSGALNKYSNECFKFSNSICELISELKRIEGLISNLK